MLPPGPRSPVPVQTAEWVLRPYELLDRAAHRYGEPFTLRTAWTRGPLVLVWSPEEVRRVLTGGLHAAGAPLVEPFAGPNSILVLEGDAHLRQRRLLLPPFHGDRMRALQPLVAELAAREVAGWRGEVAVLPRMQALTLEAIMRTVFGDGQDDLHREIRRALEVVASAPRLIAMSLVRRRRVWRRFRAAVAAVDRHLFALIESGAGGPVLDDLRAAAGPESSPQELRDQLVTILAAGHETTATALAWGIERLAHHPRALERASRDEEYLDATVREVLRSRPVLTIAPRVTAEPHPVGDHVLAPGTRIAACLYLAMRAEDDRFRPERWLEPQPPAFVPWGGGVRRCAGAAFATMEMREVLRAVARRGGLAPAGSPEAARRRSVAVAPAQGAAVVVE